MSKWIDADALKEDVARLHVLNDEAEIRRTYEYNPHVTSTDFEETLVSVFDAIDDAPSIDIPQWIPCVEEMPEEFVYVLICLKDGSMYVAQLTDYIDIWGNPKWCTNTKHCLGGAILGSEVIAWKPLPEPYGEREGE